MGKSKELYEDMENELNYMNEMNEKNLVHDEIISSITHNLKPGYIIKSGNFELVKKIEDLNELWDILNSHVSIFARHRMYPTSFFMHWNISMIKRWIDAGLFYTTKKI